MGDSQVDEQAAEAAGVPLIAYKNAALRAASHIERLKEIETILGL